MIAAQWFRRLNVQLVALLTLALFPLGSVAIFQTTRVAAETDANVGLAFLGLTERAARSEQVLIERAVGVARLFGSIAPDLRDDPEGCVPILSRFVEANAEYSFVGVLPPSGIISCSSVDDVIDFRDYAGFEETMEAQQPTIVVNRDAPASAESVFVVSEPFSIDGEFGGFISVSIPHRSLPETNARLEALGLIELITFNENGTVLTARDGLASAEAELPDDLALADIPINEAQTFRSQNRAGVERRYSIAAIEGSPAAVMAVWETQAGPLGSLSKEIAPALFPVLMWFASMGVAMLAMNTLVLRHIRRLRETMDAFVDTRRLNDPSETRAFVPLEIDDLEVNLRRMSKEIMLEEAKLEDSLREKGVLVKEIHHRVKNNLQLISSIMNMQIRAASHDETRNVLRSVQERVLSLATIHRDLYQSQNGGRVNVGALVSEIIENSVELAEVDGRRIDVTVHIDAMMLFPDQAVPLSLLVAEATTNALKFIGDTSDHTPRIEVRLSQTDRSCTLKIGNTIGETQDHDSTGLGSKLMNAFALQLGGQITVEHTDDFYEMTLDFEALEFEPEARDF